jgi:hypothetical protein
VVLGPRGPDRIAELMACLIPFVSCLVIISFCIPTTSQFQGAPEKRAAGGCRQGPGTRSVLVRRNDLDASGTKLGKDKKLSLAS